MQIAGRGLGPRIVGKSGWGDPPRRESLELDTGDGEEEGGSSSSKQRDCLERQDAFFGKKNIRYLKTWMTVFYIETKRLIWGFHGGMRALLYTGENNQKKGLKISE